MIVSDAAVKLTPSSGGLIRNALGYSCRTEDELEEAHNGTSGRPPITENPHSLLIYGGDVNQAGKNHNHGTDPGFVGKLRRTLNTGYRLS
jgi:hypothetical protein